MEWREKRMRDAERRKTEREEGGREGKKEKKERRRRRRRAVGERESQMHDKVDLKKMSVFRANSTA